MDIKKPSLFLLNLLLFLTFDLMLLGAGVRTMDAGLTCPDWPLCFGKAIPDYHFGVYLEFIHRAIAGAVGLIYIAFFYQVWTRPNMKSIRGMSIVGLLFLIAQIIMGGLTVLKLLEYYIVTLHLSLATLFLLSLYLMKKQLVAGDTKVSTLSKTRGSTFFKGLILVGSFFVVVQIVLGGLVASTYSGLVCIDFPTCNGQFFPRMVGPIAIQMWHRFGAYWLTTLIVAMFFLAILYAKPMGLSQAARKQSVKIFFIIFLQVFVGVMNLKYLMPAALSVFHLALALTLLMSLVSLWYMVTPRKTP